MQAQECALKGRVSEVERRARADECELRRQLDEATVAMSAAQLEQARLANERLQLQQHTRRLQTEMGRERRAAEDRLKLLQDQLTAKVKLTPLMRTRRQKSGYPGKAKWFRCKLVNVTQNSLKYSV